MAIIRPRATTLLEASKELQRNCKHVVVSLAGFYIYGERIGFLLSKKVDTEKDGSLNGLHVDAIGIFSFHIKNLQEYNIFCFTNFIKNQPEFLVITKSELLQRLKKHSQEDEICLRFWLTPRGENNKIKIVETNGIGAEYEFMGLWLDENRDYSQFYRNWSLINSFK